MRTAIALAAITLAAAIAVGACVGTDYVDDSVPPELRIAALPDTIAHGDTVALAATFFDHVGREAAAPIAWTSADPAVFRVTANGRGVGVGAGATTLSAEVSFGGASVSATAPVVVGEQTVVTARERRGTIRTTSSYRLEGSFTLREDGEDLVVAVGEDYRASTALPGLYVYLTNNPSTTVGAEEIGRVAVFAGAHEYRVAGGRLDDYSHLLYFCKPFNVKVGDGEIGD